jgi:hypothetical protein
MLSFLSPLTKKEAKDYEKLRCSGIAGKFIILKNMKSKNLVTLSLRSAGRK